MMKKAISVFAVFLIMALFVSNVSATSRAVPGFNVNLSLTSTRSTATIYENAMPPRTSKSLNGTYVIKDARGEKRNKPYSGSVSIGQLSVVKDADEHFVSYRSYFSYQIGGITQPEMISKYY